MNRLIATVGAGDARASVTLVTFDSHDPFDIVLDRHRDNGRPALHPGDYRPGGGTPLFDAVAATLRLASRNRGADTAAAFATVTATALRHPVPRRRRRPHRI